MKKSSIRLMGGILLAVFAFSSSLFALSSQSSYRSGATAGMFKQEYDRLYDNPAYIGAKLDGKTYIEYDKSITKEKTNIYTGLNGYNSNNRYLLGGSSSMGSFGIAGGLELGYNNSPNPITVNETVSGVNAYNTGYGKVSAGDTWYNDLTPTDGIWDNRETLTAKREDNTEESIINGILGLGGLNVGGMTLGVSFYKISDGSSVNKASRNYQYSDYNLLRDFYNSKINYSANTKDEYNYTDYVMNLGVIIPVGSMPVEGIFTFELNTSEEKHFSANATTTETNETVISTSGTTNNDSTINSDGYTLALTLQTHLELMTFMAQPYFKWEMGGTSPYKDGTARDGSSSSAVQLTNAEYVNNFNSTNTYKYTGDGIQKNSFTLGSNFRKPLTSDLLVGFGVSYRYLMSYNKYKTKFSHVAVTRSNDGNGVVDASDYTLTNTSGYTDTTETEITDHRIQLPIGVEYAATPTLTFRLGYMFTADFSFTDIKSKRSDIQASWNDYDFDMIPGNETNGPAIDALAVSGAYSSSSNTESREYNYMYNVYSFGIGYSLSDRVQLDLLFSGTGGNFNEIDSAAVMTSATFVF